MNFVRRIMLLALSTCLLSTQHVSAYCINIKRQGLEAATKAMREIYKESAPVESVDVLVFSTDERFLEYLKAMKVFNLIQAMGIGTLMAAFTILADMVVPVAGGIAASIVLSPLAQFLRALQVPIYDPYSSDAIMEGVHLRMVLHEHQGIEVPVEKRPGPVLPALPVLRKRYSGMKAGDGGKECWQPDEIKKFLTELSRGEAQELNKKWGIDKMQQGLIWKDMIDQKFLEDDGSIANLKRLYFVVVDHVSRTVLDARWIHNIDSEQITFGVTGPDGKVWPILFDYSELKK